MTAIAGEFVLGDYVARRNSAIYSEVRDHRVRQAAFATEDAPFIACK
jgi:hypothetical protein